MDTAIEVRDYINQVCDQLHRAGIPVGRVNIDSPKEAARMGRDWACIDINVARPVDALVWNSRDGWLVETHADHFPALPGEPYPDPKVAVTEMASHIHTLTHGGYLKALPLSWPHTQAGRPQFGWGRPAPPSKPQEDHVKARDLKPGHGLRAHGRAWRVTLVQAQTDGQLKVYLDADDGELFRAYDQADLYARPDQDIEAYA